MIDASIMPMNRRPYRLDPSWDEPEISLAPKGRRQWALTKPWRFRLTLNGQGYDIELPVGFRTDGASVPLLLRWLVPQHEDTWVPALIHDVLYCYQGFDLFSKMQADKLLMQGMMKLDYSWWRSIAMAEAVRLFGWFSWCRLSSMDKYNRAHFEVRPLHVIPSCECS